MKKYKTINLNKSKNSGAKRLILEAKLLNKFIHFVGMKKSFQYIISVKEENKDIKALEIMKKQ